jgi:hypothetical protein
MTNLETEIDELESQSCIIGQEAAKYRGTNAAAMDLSQRPSFIAMSAANRWKLLIMKTKSSIVNQMYRRR